MALPSQKVEIKFGASAWIDVTSDVTSFSYNRGTNRLMEDYQAGTLQVNFINNNRRFDPLNTSSDLWYSAGGYTIVQPAGQIKITLNASGAIRFYGYVQDWNFTFDQAGLDGRANLTAGDFMYYLANINFDASVESTAKLSGDRIADVLTTYNLSTTQVSGRNTKTIIGKTVHNDGDNVLAYLQNVARSSPGDLFASASSSATLVFRDKTFTPDYSWAATYRKNLIKYPAASTYDTTNAEGRVVGEDIGLGDGWLSVFKKSSNNYLYGGYSNVSETRDGTFTSYLSYQEIDQTKYNPAGSTGLSFVLSAWLQGNAFSTASAGVTGSYSLLDSSGNTINVGGSALAFYIPGTDSTTWERVLGTATAGTGIVAGVNINFSCNDSFTFKGNAWQIENNNTYDNRYFDGSYKPISSTTTNRREVGWTGTKYASDSVFSINTATAIGGSATYRTFADDNSQGTAYGNGTAISFMSLQLANSGLNLYTQSQVVGVNATATVTDTAGTALYGVRTYSQTDNLTTSVTRPKEIAREALGYWRLPEYRITEFTVSLESLTTAQQTIVLGLELTDVIRVCFKPSNAGDVVDKYYQILSINGNSDSERDNITFEVASLSNVPIRLDSTLLSILDTSILA
jgi:hypothetical protein